MIYQASARCGCVIAAVMTRNNDREDTAQTVAQYIRDGWLVDRVDTCVLGRCQGHRMLSHGAWVIAVDANKETLQ